MFDALSNEYTDDPAYRERIAREDDEAADRHDDDDEDLVPIEDDEYDEDVDDGVAVIVAGEKVWL